MSASTEALLLHLQTSAHAVLDVPAISSHLYRQFISQAEIRNVTLPDQLFRSACAACNTVWIPGKNLRVKLVHLRVAKNQVNKRRKDKRQRERERNKPLENDQEKNSESHRPSKLPNQDLVNYKSSHKRILCYSCLVCGLDTRFELPPRSARIPKTENADRTASSQNLVNSPQTSVHNVPLDLLAQNKSSASSRNRQKMRKQNSLQQMLAKAKAERERTNKNGKLKIMDIMKSA
ncbi:hypothetical protein V1514DRAFT_331809 [Lipomyces japonicus]|uniref:uncharacterized protein n=1 Tax=Lipomyces japonicus TaxID=56871 RepID=UPI0034CFCE2E